MMEKAAKDWTAREFNELMELYLKQRDQLNSMGRSTGFRANKDNMFVKTTAAQAKDALRKQVLDLYQAQVPMADIVLATRMPIPAIRLLAKQNGVRHMHPDCEVRPGRRPGFAAESAWSHRGPASHVRKIAALVKK